MYDLLKRCVYAKEICRQEDPKLQEVGEGHFYACHLARELGFVDEKIALLENE